MAIPSVTEIALIIGSLSMWAAIVVWFHIRHWDVTPREDRPDQ
jgi:hypothetical protein